MESIIDSEITFSCVLQVMRGDDGRPRDFGFVSFEEPEAAERVYIFLHLDIHKLPVVRLCYTTRSGLQCIVLFQVLMKKASIQVLPCLILKSMFVN